MGVIEIAKLFYLSTAGAWALVDVLQLSHRVKYARKAKPGEIANDRTTFEMSLGRMAVFPLNRKPFTCKQCLTGWLAGILFLKGSIPLPQALAVAIDLPFYIAGAMLAGNFIYAAFRRAVNKSH